MILTRKNFFKGSAVALGALMASAAVKTPASATTRPLYRDVPESIRLTVESAQGILNGYDDGTFRPYTGISRIALLVALHRMTTKLWGFTDRMIDPINMTNDRSRAQAFVDVPRSHPFYQYAQWAYYNRISTGTIRSGKRYFDPEVTINRADAAIFFQRTFEPAVSSVAPGIKVQGDYYPLYEARSFKDVPPHHRTYRAICWFTTTHLAQGGGFNSPKGQNMGIAGSYPDGTFRPDAPLDRYAVTIYWQRLTSYAYRAHTEGF